MAQSEPTGAASLECHIMRCPCSQVGGGANSVSQVVTCSSSPPIHKRAASSIVLLSQLPRALALASRCAVSAPLCRIRAPVTEDWSPRHAMAACKTPLTTSPTLDINALAQVPLSCSQSPGLMRIVCIVPSVSELRWKKTDWTQLREIARACATELPKVMASGSAEHRIVHATSRLLSYMFCSFLSTRQAMASSSATECSARFRARHMQFTAYHKQNSAFCRHPGAPAWCFWQPTRGP